jgi:hypothetical protein
MRRLGRLLMAAILLILISTITFYALKQWPVISAVSMSANLKGAKRTNVVVLSDDKWIRWTLSPGAGLLRIRLATGFQSSILTQLSPAIESYDLRWELLDNNEQLVDSQTVRRTIKPQSAVGYDSVLLDGSQYPAILGSPIFVRFKHDDRAKFFRMKVLKKSPDIAFVTTRIMNEQSRTPAQAKLRWQRISDRRRNDLSEMSVIPRQFIREEERYRFTMRNLRPIAPDGFNTSDFVMAQYFTLKIPTKASATQSSAKAGYVLQANAPMAFSALEPGTYVINETSEHNPDLKLWFGTQRDSAWHWTAIAIDAQQSTKVSITQANTYAIQSSVIAKLQLLAPSGKTISLPQGTTQYYAVLGNTPVRYKMHLMPSVQRAQYRLGVRTPNAQAVPTIELHYLDKSMKLIAKKTISVKHSNALMHRFMRAPFSGDLGAEHAFDVMVPKDVAFLEIHGSKNFMVRLMNAIPGKTSWFGMRPMFYDKLLNNMQMSAILIPPTLFTAPRIANSKHDSEPQVMPATLTMPSNATSARLWVHEVSAAKATLFKKAAYRLVSGIEQIGAEGSPYIFEKLSDGVQVFSPPDNVASDKTQLVRTFEKVILKSRLSKPVRFDTAANKSLRIWKPDAAGESGIVTVYRIAEGKTLSWALTGKAQGSFSVWAASSKNSAHLLIKQNSSEKTLRIPFSESRKANGFILMDTAQLSLSDAVVTELATTTEATGNILLTAEGGAVYVYVVWKNKRVLQ